MLFAYTSTLDFISFCFACYSELFSYNSAYEYEVLEGNKSSNFYMPYNSWLKDYVLRVVGA